MNLASLLRENARRAPAQVALIHPEAGDYVEKTYADLDRASDAHARGFARAGIAKGTRTIVMVKPGFELFAVLFGLIKLGAVPVIVDPGMGVTRMLHCYRSVGAEAFVGIPVAHVVRVLSPRTFRGLSTLITVGRRLFWGGASLDALSVPSSEPYEIAPCNDGDLLFVNFTTGSTGPAKGVEFTHGMARAMLESIRTNFTPSGESTSFATLPIFVVFDLLLGSRSVLPAMDPNKPGFVDAQRMIDDMRRFGATHMFASPAFLRRIGTHAQKTGQKLDSLSLVVSGGAPVSDAVLETVRPLLGESARLLATYGATEALPMATISAEERLSALREETRAGRGTCVGKPVPRVQVRIARISDSPLAQWTRDIEAPHGEVGEICVAGSIVSPRYHLSPAWDERAKIADGTRSWHRTGDLGYLDDSGRIWFCGRKSQRVETVHGTLFTVREEGRFNAHPDVFRTALVGVRGQAVLCVELEEGVTRAPAEVCTELSAIARQAGLELAAILVHPRFPVDIRHNAKIGREVLARWADRRIHGERVRFLYAVPVGGWLFLAAAPVVPLMGPVFVTLWWVDLFLSVFVHGAQLPLALPRGKRAGFSTAETVFRTFLLGATWWKFLDDEVSP